MKTLISTAILFFSINSWACPNLTGNYISPSKETIKIVQMDCSEIALESKDLNQTLLLNNQYVIVQDDKDLEAQGRGAFIGDLLVLEVKVKYKTLPPIPRILLPVRAVNKYTQMSDGNLMEVSAIYNEMNGVLTSGKTLYKKQP